MSKKSVSLASLDASALGDTPFEFEYLTQKGEGTGVFLSVLGSETETVTKIVNEMVNDRRRKESVAKMNNQFRNKNSAEYETIESDVEFGQRLSAARLVGWRGIEDAFSPENALKLCKSNRDIAAQITQKSDDTANFLKL